MTQHLRQSQFVLTWGPGSILEGPDGPRLIPAPDIGLFYQNTGRTPERFEISDRRMSEGLLNGARIFRLPSNAELGIVQSQPLYRTRPFPEWKICHNTGNHTHNGQSNFSVLFPGNKCPLCNAYGEAVRFVRACPAGHLDDVDWIDVVHGKRICSGSTGTPWLIWTGGGGSLAQINIECPWCGVKVSLGWAYQQTWSCSGRHPEREALNARPHRPGCSRTARMILRQASNLRIPEIRTLFTIPPRHTRLHNLLQLSPIYHAIVANPPGSSNQLRAMLNNLQTQGLISQVIVSEILQHPWNEIQQAIQDVLSPVTPHYSDLLLEEFHAFIDASIKGIPPVTGPRPSSPVLIEVNPRMVKKISGPRGTSFRIVPVQRLRTVIVQQGYRREVDTRNPAQIVDVSFADPSNPSQKWYPGVEFFGEGIFIMLDHNDGWQNSALKGDDAERWFKTFEGGAQTSYPGHIFRDRSHRDELHPAFIWWHTLSHLLIRAISGEAGYPSASIRERVYLEVQNNTRVRGGILLYAVQPGSEGTMGGLMALAPHFKKILYRALDMLENCSGDPLCIENAFSPGHYCGAACYGCLFLSETSCEHRNMWLDRRILMDNLP